MSCDEPELEFRFSDQILQKLDEKHGVTIEEVYEAFDNSDGRTLIDTRDRHKSHPPTEWFISQTRKGRSLKICYIFDEDKNIIFVKTAYEPNAEEVRIFNKYA
ncbi:hypothetical protein F965_00142 [Acinetobacter schindleri NIPH 900]|uniref:ADP-ribosyl-(Dinitrogen reductase) hydrolase n=1 Tax=Acinetobacter schindleri NIPH 900 TaxID=1217675 RepID=N8Y4Y1_9GAMM|nr:MULTISPECIES: hypothetical protein [Acinetobacter]ENV14663.1 hypothetical protein F965_00142 [Acinetobacter schindleri NIPH 900]